MIDPFYYRHYVLYIYKHNLQLIFFGLLTLALLTLLFQINEYFLLN